MPDSGVRAWLFHDPDILLVRGGKLGSVDQDLLLQKIGAAATTQKTVDPAHQSTHEAYWSSVGCLDRCLSTELF